MTHPVLIAPSITPTAAPSDLPLCVDLDGTLLETDTLLEAVLALIKQRPWLLFVIPVWALRGKTFLKKKVAEESPLDVTLLPLKRDFLQYLRAEHAGGRRLILATATHMRFAQRIASHLDIFSETMATDDTRNLRGSEKSRLLCERFGSGGFDYAANAYADIPIWENASGVILVNAPRLLAHALGRRSITIQRVFSKQKGTGRALLRSLRMHQWAKNLLVFAPLLLSHNQFHPARLLGATLAFVSFSLCASGVYLLNDLLDLESDRRHAKKRFRPLASGQLSIATALAAVPLLTGAAFAIAAFALPRNFLITLACYWAATLAYSLYLKSKLLIDVVTLASLYTVRIIAGGAATRIAVSPWTLGFSVALFLSLALVKRYSELRGLTETDFAHGRAYQAADVSILSSAGLASGYMSIVVMALYINSPEVSLLYSRPLWLGPICLVQIYFVSRFWLLAHRGKVEEDPVIFALRDPVNLLLAAIACVFVFLAL
jgi:4-hydroxybenzoate polyprenyltransferase